MITTLSSATSRFDRLPRLELQAGTYSVQGPRRDRNEDTSFISPNLDLFIVADGMGGHEAGELASRIAVDSFAQSLAHVSEQTYSAGEIEFIVRKAIKDASCLVASINPNEPPNKRACTTVALALVQHNRLSVASVGDSRVYLIRDARIQQLTSDDCIPSLLANAGVITPAAAKTHPWRHCLLASLGMENIPCGKSIGSLDLQPGDRLLLTTDGLTGVVEDEVLCRTALTHTDPQRAAEALIRQALANDTGDDTTCLVCYVHPLKEGRSRLRSFLRYVRDAWRVWRSRVQHEVFGRANVAGYRGT